MKYLSPTVKALSRTCKSNYSYSRAKHCCWNLKNFDSQSTSESGIRWHHFDTIFSHFNFLISGKRSNNSAHWTTSQEHSTLKCLHYWTWSINCYILCVNLKTFCSWLMHRACRWHFESQRINSSIQESNSFGMSVKYQEAETQYVTRLITHLKHEGYLNVV